MSEPELSTRLRAEGLDPGTWGNDPGDVYAVHRHGYDKVIVCVRGSITFGFPARNERIQLRAGDRLELPATVDHDAVVGAIGVACLEAHVPAERLGGDPVLRTAGKW